MHLKEPEPSPPLTPSPPKDVTASDWAETETKQEKAHNCSSGKTKPKKAMTIVIALVSLATIVALVGLIACNRRNTSDGEVLTEPFAASDASFSLTVSVRIAGSGNSWSEDLITVNPGDTLDYLISYENTDEIDQADVVVRNHLPKNMAFVPGSVFLINTNNPSPGKNISDTIFSNGSNIGTYAGTITGSGTGANAYVTFQAVVPDNDDLEYSGENTLSNYAIINTADGGLYERIDVSVHKNEDRDKEISRPSQSPGQSSQADFTITQRVRFAHQTDWQTAITASPGDRIQYRIDFDNIGEATQNQVIIQVHLPTGIAYTNGSTFLINASFPRPGTNLLDDWIAKGQNIGNYTAGANAIIVFDAVVQGADAIVHEENLQETVALAFTEDGTKLATTGVIVLVPANPP